MIEKVKKAHGFATLEQAEAPNQFCVKQRACGDTQATIDTRRAHDLLDWGSLKKTHFERCRNSTWVLVLGRVGLENTSSALRVRLTFFDFGVCLECTLVYLNSVVGQV